MARGDQALGGQGRGGPGRLSSPAFPPAGGPDLSLLQSRTSIHPTTPQAHLSGQAYRPEALSASQRGFYFRLLEWV